MRVMGSRGSSLLLIPPQQNRVVERRNRTAMEMAKSMMNSMGAPSRLWGEVVWHSVYLLNHLPTKAMGDMIVLPMRLGMGENHILGI